MDYAALKTLIQATTAAAERYAIGDDTGTAAVLNHRSQPGPVPLAEVAAFALATGLIGSVQALDAIPIGATIDAQSGTVMTLQIKGLVRSVIAVIESTSRLATANFSSPSGAAMLNGLQSLGVLSTEVRQALVHLADNRLSLAESTVGALVTADDIARTRGI